MKKLKNKKVCKHNLVYVEHFISIEKEDVYRFICNKPNCLTIVDVKPNQ